MSCGVDRRRSLDLVLLWLWRRPVAIGPIGPLAWEPPYAMDGTLKRQKKPKTKTKLFVYTFLFLILKFLVKKKQRIPFFLF